MTSYKLKYKPTVLIHVRQTTLHQVATHDQYIDQYKKQRIEAGALLVQLLAVVYSIIFSS